MDRAEKKELVETLGQVFKAANVVVVPIYARDHCMLQPERRDSFGNAARLIQVDGRRPSLWHGAKPATPGADIAQKHESCRAVIPALPDVRALSRFADSM